MKYRKLKYSNEQIISEYKNGASTYELQNKCGISRETIRKILIKNNIKRRNISEINHMRFKNTITVSNTTLEIITGWLLGDGGIRYVGKQAYFCLTSKHKEYIDYAKKIFYDQNIKCIINKVKNGRHIAYKLFTESTLQFAEIYKKWYHNDKKIVPNDIDLNSATIKHWIIDDGSVNKNHKYLSLATCAFENVDCENLVNKIKIFIGFHNLSGNNIKVMRKYSKKNKKTYPIIYVNNKDAVFLIKKIGSCPVQCLKYKWDKVLEKSNASSYPNI